MGEFGKAELFQLRSRHSCPAGCGLCPEHKQHACRGIIEVNTGCNLDCPICFADSGHQPDGVRHHHRAVRCDDGFDERTHRAIRGRDLRGIKQLLPLVEWRGLLARNVGPFARAVRQRDRRDPDGRAAT